MSSVPPSASPSAPAAPPHWSARNIALLALLTLFWGINWPIMKYAVHSFPPLSFRFLSMGGGVLTLWLAARAARIPLAIPPGKAWTIVGLAIPNMVIWHLFAIYAIVLLSSGRSAILGYTMPVFALLAAWALHGDRPGPRQWIGVACAAVATALLLASDFDKLSGAPLGTALMLIAAAGWGAGTALLRRTPLAMPTHALTFWMMLVATVALGLGALATESARWRAPTPGEWAAIAYNAVIGVGLCHLIWFSIARALPPVASGLSLMMIPVLGVFSGALVLHETLRWQDYAAVALVLAALASVLNLRRIAPEPQE